MPAVSSSVLVTSTSARQRRRNRGPCSRRGVPGRSTPDCRHPGRRFDRHGDDLGAAQFAGVKVSVPGLTRPSLSSSLTTSIVTLAVGSEFRTTRKVSSPPASVVVAVSGVTLMPGVSLSMFVTVRSRTVMPS